MTDINILQVQIKDLIRKRSYSELFTKLKEGVEEGAVTHILLNGSKRRVEFSEGNVIYYENNWIKLPLKPDQVLDVTDVTLLNDGSNINGVNKDSRRYYLMAKRAEFCNRFIEHCVSADITKSPVVNGVVHPKSNITLVGKTIKINTLSDYMSEDAFKKLLHAITHNGHFILNFKYKRADAHLCVGEDKSSRMCAELTIIQGGVQSVYSLINKKNFIYTK